MLNQTNIIRFSLFLFSAFIIPILFTTCTDKPDDPVVHISFNTSSEIFYQGCTLPIIVNVYSEPTVNKQAMLFVNEKEIGFTGSAPDIFYFETDTITADKLSIKAVYQTDDATVWDEKEIELVPVNKGCPSDIVDVDGNIYPVVRIGNQCWTQKNIQATHYPDGVSLINGIDSLIVGGPAELPGWYFAYNRDTGNSANYGFLYTWSSALNGTKAENNSDGPIQGICPDGWHIPSEKEWWTLIDFLGGYEIAGNKLKDETNLYWTDNLLTTTNKSKFTALPGGTRVSMGTYYLKGVEAYFWSSTETIPNHAFHMLLKGNSSKTTILGHQDSKRFAYSVRCLKN